jgi:hypothetical protein
MTQPRSAFSSHRENPRGNKEGIALTAARPVMVCGLRKPASIGFDMLAPGGILIMAFALLLAGPVLNFPLVTWLFGNTIARGDDSSLRLFALVFLVLGFWLRHQRRKEKLDPNRPHRLDPGTSWFTFLPIRQDYVYRYVDPGVAFLVGALLRTRLGCPLLGLYLMVAGVALAVFEWELHQATEAHEWQLGDSPKEAARDAATMKTMAGRDAKPSQDAAIPTGMDADLAADIRRRQREQATEVANELG